MTEDRQILRALREQAAKLLREIDRALAGPRKNTSQRGKGCAVCGQPARARGLCKKHYQVKWHAGEVGQHGTVERRW